MDIEHIWFGKDLGARCIRMACIPASWLYTLGWKAYLGLYNSGLKNSYLPSLPTFVVGNFTVGGSGKTPATLAVVQLIRDLGYEPVVSTSGYGSPSAHGVSWLPQDQLALASQYGDEPLVFRYYDPDLPIIVGRNRVQAARAAEAAHPNSILVLDDGLQHLPLATHGKIVLNPIELENRHALPAGPYREPFDPKRTDFVIPKDAQLIRSTRRIMDAQLHLEVELESQTVQALAAIARPQRFFAALSAMGFEVSQAMPLGDHDPLTAGTLLSSFDPEIPIAVTVKDWVKLRERSDCQAYQFWIVEESARFEPDAPLRKLLHETIQVARA